MALRVSMRPKQWTKNLFVLAPLGFAGATALGGVMRALVAFSAFCLAASGLYLLNDVSDREFDRQFDPAAPPEAPPSRRHR